MFKVTLANGINFDAEPEQTILDAASKCNLTLEHSCRTGRCGVCKAQVINGSTETVKPEEGLTDEDISKGIILTCCRSASSEVHLNIEDLGDIGNLQVKTLPCRIDSLSKLSDDVIQVILRTPPNNNLEYFPGQYVDVIGKNGLRRSYSVANAPKEDGKIELQIRQVENGLMSDYWFNHAQVNDLFRLEGALGTFFLRKNQASTLVLLATGTGIAPVKAMLEHLHQNPDENHYNQICLYWGGRYERDIYWQPDFETLNLSFIPVLSRQKEWQGRVGYVQSAVVKDSLDLTDSVVYACGSVAMIQDAKQQLIAAGLNDKYFYSDAFVSSS